MKSSVAVYNSHDDAIHALTSLKINKFPLEKVSIIGQAEIIDDKIHLRSNKPLIATPLAAGTTVGIVLGLLTGIGIFAIPGFGMLFGAGALIGALAGFEVGAIAGGATSFFLSLGIKTDYVAKYEEHLRNGKFLIFINGTKEEIDSAKDILEHQYLDFNVY